MRRTAFSSFGLWIRPLSNNNFETQQIRYEPEACYRSDGNICPFVVEPTEEIKLVFGQLSLSTDHLLLLLSFHWELGFGGELLQWRENLKGSEKSANCPRADWPPASPFLYFKSHHSPKPTSWLGQLSLSLSLSLLQPSLCSSLLPVLQRPSKKVQGTGCLVAGNSGLDREREMGQAVSCGVGHEYGFLSAIEQGDVDTVISMLESKPKLIHKTTHDNNSTLHIASVNGQIEVLALLLDRSLDPDVLNRHKQTPLMLAAMHGKTSSVQKLLEAGANILKFDSLRGRTCLHYAAYHGHLACLEAIISAARSDPVADSWGFARFINVRDGSGATPLHLAARGRRPDCVHILLGNGALVCASTGSNGVPGNTPLHLAARAGSLDCVRELLAWGADRLQRDVSGRIPYAVALRGKHSLCAALLNPTAAEPLVWPSPLKFISELNPEAKSLLEKALMEANREREKGILKGTPYLPQSPDHPENCTDDDRSEASDSELCCICFEQICTIEVQNCGHQMCAHCTLALCCHNKPNPTTACLLAPVCPFCRSNIAQLAVAKTKADDTYKDVSRNRNMRRSRNLSEGSSSFKGLSAMGSFGKGCTAGSGKIVDSGDWLDKS